MKIYIINLLKATERRIFQEQQMQTLGLIDNVEFLEAISVDKLENIHPNLLMGWERPLRLAELACYQSHLHAWQKVLSTQTPALILEDDALLASNIKDLLDTLENIKHYNYITLETRNRKKLLGKAVPLTNNYSISRLYQDRTGAAAYILYPLGAKILVDKAEKTSPALADAFISSTYELNAYQIEPAAAIQIDQCENYNILAPISVYSFISTENKNSKKSFLRRRLIAQLKIAKRFLQKILCSNRRYVSLSSNF